MIETSDVAAVVPRPTRLTLSRFAATVQRELLSLDRGWAGTWLSLWRRPGATIRRYVEWRDSSLTPPLRYLIVNLALCALLVSLFDIGADYRAGLEQGYAAGSSVTSSNAARMAAVLQRVDLWLWLACLPAMALALERVYQPTMNLAEALAFSSYVMAQTSPGILILLMVVTALEWGGALPVVIVLGPLYFVTACRGYFAPEAVAPGRALAATVLTLALLGLFTVALVFLAIAWIG